MIWSLNTKTFYISPSWESLRKYPSNHANHANHAMLTETHHHQQDGGINGSSETHKMTSIYIKSLETEWARQRQREIRARRGSDPSRELRDSIAHWHALLPVELRQRPYTMVELVNEFQASRMALGIALSELGWARKRNWRGPGPYVRYWVPPIGCGLI